MKEQISALMDGELDVSANPHLLTALKNDRTLDESWAAYHLIGDVMRGDPAFNAGLGKRIMAQLEQEPTVLAPRRTPLLKRAPSFVWSASSAVAAVAFVGWMVWSQQHISSPASLSPAVAQNNVSPEAINPYLLAHQEFASGGDIQAASYVRQVAYGNGN